MNHLTGKPRLFARLVFSVISIPGVVLWIDFIRTRSEMERRFLFGYSETRLAVIIIFSILVLLNICAVFWTTFTPGRWQVAVENKITSWILSHPTPVFAGLWLVALITGFLLLILIPPVIRAFIFFEPVGVQLGGFLAWLFLASSLLTVYFRIAYREYFIGDRLVFALDRLLILTAIFLAVFFLYEHILIWTGAAEQSRYSYWNLLADAFLQGKLYLQDPPQTHDLTLYAGKWYVAMPPTPAILMMPLAFWVGGANINTHDFSILLSAVNVVLIFLILEQLNARKWIRLSKIGLLVLITLFAFGTPHLWVGISGRAWFVSQIVTVTFLALAVFAALKLWPPWLAGISLGLAVAARPNSIMMWFFVFALAMQILKEKQGGITFKQMLGWMVGSVVPVGLAVAGLLFYNHARFENYFDFGYVTISGDPGIVANATTYGIFSSHYIPMNLKVMFLYIPTILPGGRWPILPSTTGMSIFLVTPPLIYLFRRYERHWWILGAWTSVFLIFLLLVLYHNTGAHQFGYRYILDAMIPLLALLALALGGKLRWHFVLLTLFSIGFNIYGAYWFVNG